MRHISVLGLLAIVLTLSIGLVGCFDRDDVVAPETSLPETGVLDARNPGIQVAMAVQNRHTKRLMEDPDVVGTATGLTDDGRPAVLILVTSDRAAKAIPAALDGTPVRLIRTDPIVAYKGKPPPDPGTGTDHQGQQSWPIQLGTSGGNVNDIANGYCCSGTLGSLVQIGGTQYILSNSHVFAGDVVSGGNGRVAHIGDAISQPGLIDNGCRDPNSDVASLSSLSSIYPPGSTPNIDAAIAQVTTGAVSSAILEIGNISSATVGASVNQNVKKSGRTSGLTRSRIEGINMSVNVGYSDECAGNSFTKSYTGQILIRNKGSKFLAGGDSGSLMVEDVDTSPRAVGLLYAGSSQVAVANPIDDVLDHFNASMVP